MIAVEGGELNHVFHKKHHYFFYVYFWLDLFFLVILFPKDY